MDTIALGNLKGRWRELHRNPATLKDVTQAVSSAVVSGIESNLLSTLPQPNPYVESLYEELYYLGIAKSVSKHRAKLQRYFYRAAGIHWIQYAVTHPFPRKRK